MGKEKFTYLFSFEINENFISGNDVVEWEHKTHSSRFKHYHYLLVNVDLPILCNVAFDPKGFDTSKSK